MTRPAWSVIDRDFADPADFIGRDVVLVARQKTELEGSPFTRYFKNVERLLPIMVERAGEPVSTLDLAVGHALQVPRKRVGSG